MTRIYWCSFVDPDLPEGQRNLGVCIVDITEQDAQLAKDFLERSRFRETYNKAEGPWVAAVSQKAHRMSCNPGGEMASWRIDEHPDRGWLASLPRNTLLTGAEADALNSSPWET